MKTLHARLMSVSTVSAARLWAWLLLPVLLVVGMGVRAQEVSRVFTAPNGTVHPTLKQAEAAMLAQYPNYHYLQNVSYANGKTYHNYTRGSGLPITSVWVDYDIAGSGGTYLTEDEAVVAMELGLLGTVNGHGYNCTGAKASPTSEWDRVQGWINGPATMEGRNYYVTFAGCSHSGSASSMNRSRTAKCPADLVWSSQSRICMRGTSVVSIVSKPLSCTSGCNRALVGNPIDVSTGDKYQSEPADIDVGWFTFRRHYHSAAVTARAGLGRGWTHDDAMQLLLSGTSVGLVRETGTETGFQLDGSDYLAMDGSGDVITKLPDRYVLQTGSRSVEFDLDGLMTRIRDDDGDDRHYERDGLGRIVRIVHASGRSLLFDYHSQDTWLESRLARIRMDDVVLAQYAYTGEVLTQVQFADGSSRSYLYEDARFPWHLTGIVAENGTRLSTYAYDQKGRALSSQHAGGVQATTVSYPAAGGAIVTDPLAGTRQFALSAAGTLNPVRHVEGITRSDGSELLSYDPESTDVRRRLKSHTDRRGIQTRYDHADGTDPVSGQTVSMRTVHEAFGLTQQRTTQTQRLRNSNRLLATVIANRETRIARNARLQPTAVSVKDTTTGTTRTTTTTYCEQSGVDGGTCPLLGLVLSVDGPRSDVNDAVTYTYRAADHADCAASPASCAWRKGDLWKTTNALGHATEVLAYDGAGRVLSVKDANGVITDLSYHPRGWLTASKQRGTNAAVETDDAITRIDYWPTGLVKQVTQPDGSFTAYSYDAAQRLTRIADNAGNTLTYTLDNAGNRIAEKTRDASGTLKRSLSRVYNQLGQLATQADAFANPTDYTYDADGNTATITDALGRVTDHDHDPLNRLVRTLQNVGGIAAQTQFQYDALDNLTRVTDPKGLNTTYTYNGLGDLTQLSSPDTGTTRYSYDTAGNRKTQTDARNITSTYSYDALNRLTGIAYADASQNVGYSYDTAPAACPANERSHAGRLASLTDPSGHTVYCWNRFGQLVRKVQTTAGKAFTVRYVYSATGQLRNVIYPDGSNVDYAYNSLGQATQVGLTRTGATRQLIATGITYAPFGPITRWTDGQGRVLTRTYNLNYQPQSIRDPATGGMDLAFQYDAVGNLTTLKTAAGASKAQYGYDALNRLTQTKDGPTGTPIDTYAYDATGNRTRLTTATGTHTYSYPGTSHRLSSVAGVARSYDAVGNTTAIGGTAKQFTYNAANRMSEVKTAGTVTRRYQYNGKGEQVRSHPGTGGTTTVYDDAGHWLGDYDSVSGVAIQQAIWLGDLPVGLISGSGTTQRVQYVQPDHLGSPRVVIDAASNTAVWKWELTGEAFGATPPNQDPDGNGQPFVLNMRFPGQRFDAATGLNYNYFRDYEPNTGRYVQSDPIGFGGGISTFAYAGGSPMVGFDPLGLECRTIYGLFLNVITCDPPFASSGSSGSSRGRFTPDEQSMIARYCPGENKCEEIKSSVNNLLTVAEGQIQAMRNDRSLRNLYELAFSVPNPEATGTRTTWQNHREKTAALLDRISRMIDLGQKLGCNMSSEYSRYIMLQVPYAPD